MSVKLPKQMQLRKSKGNMFKSVTHTATFYRGCDHECVYCWARMMGLSHEPKLIQTDEHEILKVQNAVIFLNSAYDSFAKCIPSEWIISMLRWIRRQHPSNKFLLQTKNPQRMFGFLKPLLEVKDRVRLGTTVETNRDTSGISKASSPRARAWALATLREKYGFETFLSFEPLMNFNLERMLVIVRAVAPFCIEIGFDNWEHKHKVHLKRPKRKKYLRFRDELDRMGYPYLEKPGLVKWLNK